MNYLLRNALGMACLAFAVQAGAQVSFYQDNDFYGRSFTTNRSVSNFNQHEFNDRASSAVVLNQRWEVCVDARFAGRCAVLRPGRYPSLAAMGLDNRITSARVLPANANVAGYRYAPEAAPAYDNHRRGNERLYDADIVSVRAIAGPPEQRCWMEKEQVVTEDRSQLNMPGAIAGALIGGVLGHQVGGGRGKDLATVGGVVAGAAVGANVGRDRGGQQVELRDVQRCETTANRAQPDHWDVVYNFRGQEHRIQMTTPPGDTVRVNRYGEPRA